MRARFAFLVFSSRGERQPPSSQKNTHHQAGGRICATSTQPGMASGSPNPLDAPTGAPREPGQEGRKEERRGCVFFRERKRVERARLSGGDGWRGQMVRAQKVGDGWGRRAADGARAGLYSNRRRKKKAWRCGVAAAPPRSCPRPIAVVAGTAAAATQKTPPPCLRCTVVFCSTR